MGRKPWPDTFAARIFVLFVVTFVTALAVVSCVDQGGETERVQGKRGTASGANGSNSIATKTGSIATPAGCPSHNETEPHSHRLLEDKDNFEFALNPGHDEASPARPTTGSGSRGGTPSGTISTGTGVMSGRTGSGINGNCPNQTGSGSRSGSPTGAGR